MTATITQLKNTINIKETFFGKDIRTQLNQIYIALDTKYFSVDVQTDTTYDDNMNKIVSVDLYIRKCNCETGEDIEETLDCITIHSPLFSTFEDIRINCHQNKEEIYLDIYEDFTYEDDFIETFSITAA